jgi:hypothetical protein
VAQGAILDFDRHCSWKGSGRRTRWDLIQLKLLSFYPIASSAWADETIIPGEETIFHFWRRHPETALGYQFDNDNGGGNAGNKTGDSQMRTLSFILAFAFVLAGPSLAGSADNSLPGVGTFSYSGSPLAVPHALLVAAQ